MKKVLRFVTLAAAMLMLACPLRAGFPLHRLGGVEPVVYYGASQALEKGSDSRMAVIYIHGWGGGTATGENPCNLQNALGDAIVIAPQFPRRMVMESKGVTEDGRAVWNDSWSKDLTKPGVPDDDWRGGGDANGTTLSSYDVIDAILAKLSDKKLFPKMKRVVLAGFSAGGQFVGRYVAVGKGEVRKGIRMVYVAMSPSTDLLPDDDVIWHYGFKGRPRYSRSLSREQIMANLHSRFCLHGCGDKDVLDKSLDMTPAAMMQGRNRYLRYLHFQEVVNADPKWKKKVTFYTFEGLGHDSAKAYATPFLLRYMKKK